MKRISVLILFEHKLIYDWQHEEVASVVAVKYSIHRKCTAQDHHHITLYYTSIQS